ncbi:HAMP domain-containing sensor histidine kinase [Actinoplanes sp. NPDC026623]|uniref:sensor histidine kinase n=1 Tax=Actinoplanes sp. NPDC026623 TaxID=3155610 RepID=UPI0033E7F331
MTRTRVPARHSLVTKLLATSILIAVAAIGATAWLATRTATRAISQERGRSLTEDKGVYDMLVAYAATHPDWSGAPDLIRTRAAELDRRITLMTEDRVVIADSAAGPSLRTARPSAVVDPLNLDPGLTGGTDRIDGRAVGPYWVPPGERTTLRKAAADELTCLRKRGLDGKVVERPSGRPAITLTVSDPAGVAPLCHQVLATMASGTEQKALRSLGLLATRCLGLENGSLHVQVQSDYSTYLAKGPVTDAGSILESKDGLPAPQTAEGAARVRSCVEKSRRTQLQPYVAPPALLFVTDPAAGADQTRFTMSAANTTRIATVTGAVLLATIAVTILVGRRLIRPLRALTEAADLHTPAPVSTRDEIGRLAQALNDSAARREQAETQRRAMVSDVAHELRTPLTNIRSWLEAAQDGLAPTDVHLLGLLHEEAVLLQHVIDDLTDLAAADAGTLRLHPEPTYVRDVVTQVAESHRGTAHAAGVHLAIEVRDEPVLRADPVRLRQMVGNLVSNGIRHTPRGGTVTIGAHDTTITVRDTGTGISAEHVDKIFNRFWRADRSRSRTTGGSGLGLAIARQLTEAHGGTIEVRSEPGRGALFTIRLPEDQVPSREA